MPPCPPKGGYVSYRSYPPSPLKGGTFMNMKKVLLKNENKPPFSGSGGQKTKKLWGCRAATKKETKWILFSDRSKKKTIRK
jgi:hypothetical protein